jgi:hypothetical protein
MGQLSCRALTDPTADVDADRSSVVNKGFTQGILSKSAGMRKDRVDETLGKLKEDGKPTA